MSLVYVEDKGGNTIKFREWNGRYYTDFPLDSLKHATEVEARPDDILLVTFPKSGTHWTSEIIQFLVSGSTNIPLDKRVVYFVDKHDREAINGLPLESPRNLAIHYHADTLSRDFLRKKSKIIYVTRNPRDVVTSFFHHHRKLRQYYDYDGEWADHLDLFLEGKMDYDSWFEHTKGWEKCIKDHPDNPFLVLTYEGLKQDPLGNVKKISDFIGMDCREEFLEDVVAKTSFESMLQIRNIEQDEDVVYYRKGQVDDWKNHFTVAQAEIFNDIFEKEMAGTDVYYILILIYCKALRASACHWD